MKLSIFLAELTCMKSMFARTLAGAVFAGAALTASAPAAFAQHVALGFQIGTPGYVAPVPLGDYGYGPPYYGSRYDAWREHGAWARQEEWRRREEWRRHQEWLRYHGGLRGYDSHSYGDRPF